MLSFSRTLLLSVLFLSVKVQGQCGDNGDAELGWGSQADADSTQTNPSTVLGFSDSGPFDAEGNPILSVIATGAGFDSDYYAFTAFICGQANPDSYPQTTWGSIITASSNLNGVVQQCLTVSTLNATNATISLQPCVNDVTTPPVASQTFEWIGTNYITYGWAFIGGQGPLPLSPSASTDYVPSIVNASGSSLAVGSYVRLDYVPGGLPPSTGSETGLILELSDD